MAVSLLSSQDFFSASLHFLRFQLPPFQSSVPSSRRLVSPYLLPTDHPAVPNTLSISVPTLLVSLTTTPISSIITGAFNIHVIHVDDSSERHTISCPTPTPHNMSSSQPYCLIDIIYVLGKLSLLLLLFVLTMRCSFT